MMLKHFAKRFVVVPALASAVWGGGFACGSEVSAPARVLKYSGSDGQVFSAIVLNVGQLPQGVVGVDHVIVVDTSASQVGEHREQALGVLESLLKSLPAQHRVRILACDVQAEALDDGFQGPQSTGVQDSLELLKSRIPLGATNLEGALRTALQMTTTDRPADITYIGDGMSTADLIELPELRTLVTDLRARKVPVHGFGVGAQTNLQLLGILAQQTGGFVTFDSQVAADSSTQGVEKTKSAKLRKDISRATASASQKAVQQGQQLAAALQAPVFFPTELQVTSGHVSLLPSEPLPVRTDRETIYLAAGSLPADARVVLSDAAPQDTLEWKLAAPLEQPGATFLPVMARQLEQTGGLTNSLAGMTLFQLAQVDFSDQVTLLAQRGQQALQRGDVQQAQKLADLTAQAEPRNEAVKALRTATGRLNVRPVKRTQADPPEPMPDLEPRVAPNPNASLLDDQEERIRVQTQKLRNEVSNAIETARKIDDAETGLGILKQALGAVKSAIDVPPEHRQRMEKQLDSEILQAENQKEQRQQTAMRTLERRAQQEALKRLAEQAMLDEERLENLIDRVRALMLEGRHGRDDAFAEAQEVADVAINMRPGEGTSAAARFDSEAAHQITRAYRMRARRADQFLETAYLVELSHVPFPDEPPVRYPAPEVWKALSARRKERAAVDLKRTTPNERRIKQALSETTEVSFTDNPLEEALSYLEDLHHIEIWIDKQALTDEGINTDTQVTLVMSGITLRSALRLLLEPLALTYVIEDEVMKITTQTKADEKMSTRIYPVADVVMPIPNAMMMGGGGGMMGGGMGGGMMGGGMGGGMMGGGMGGMGGMGGGMGGMGGGMFSMPPEPVDTEHDAGGNDVRGLRIDRELHGKKKQLNRN